MLYSLVWGEREELFWLNNIEHSMIIYEMYLREDKYF